MKSIIIIDDSDLKRDTISEYMEEIFPDAELFSFEFINDALMFIARERSTDIKSNPNNYLVITDMQLPRYEGSNIVRFGGTEILSEMHRKRFKCPAILQSSGDLDFEKYKELYENLLGVVRESPVIYNLSKYEELLADYIE